MRIYEPDNAPRAPRPSDEIWNQPATATDLRSSFTSSSWKFSKFTFPFSLSLFSFLSPFSWMLRYLRMLNRDWGLGEGIFIGWWMNSTRGGETREFSSWPQPLTRVGVTRGRLCQCLRQLVGGIWDVGCIWRLIWGWLTAVGMRGRRCKSAVSHVLFFF